MASSLDIVLAFDDNFWAPAYAVMRSICLSTHRRQDLVFHLLHLPLLAEHKRDLEAITGEFGAKIAWHPLDGMELFDVFVADMPASAQWPKVVYARLLLADILPEAVSRVLYLDCDMLVRAPIERLLEADLGGMPLGAVQDSLHPFIMGRRDMRQNSGIFDLADPYFNSGMLVVDLAQWRAIDVKSEVALIAGKGWLDRLYYDQDVLNLVFRNRWHKLDWRWNTMDAHPAHEALDPHILHFTGKNRPWALWAGILRTTAYARWYRHVMTNDLFYRFARHRWGRWWRKRLPFLR
ncbi:Lipopolysaccharide biosynthesis protein, LPS:glycosyltransferase [Devosia crocina]|uniref:Lipopolysaccharide biosynthesis protein, LPS:glycosyltransferase n=1 Tax=Devosia crocina TaxID=429728 RepID=A0A1I7NW30_9HYPH|nr:glycosyltransferase family 8 protein [Devosia crocina]SFV38852.1 Lipopolysaccharide biosynthesis protein, LPS:glycosyltransferase [Devosia crocina]